MLGLHPGVRQKLCSAHKMSKGWSDPGWGFEDTAPTSVRVMLLWLHTSRARLNWQACISSCTLFSCSPCSKKKSAAVYREATGCNVLCTCRRSTLCDFVTLYDCQHTKTQIIINNQPGRCSMKCFGPWLCLWTMMLQMHCQAMIGATGSGKPTCRLRKMAEH